MSDKSPIRVMVLSVVKHDYIALAFAADPRFQLVVVADDSAAARWAHERNQQFADRFGVPYVCDPIAAINNHQPQVAVVSSEAERHAELAIKAANAGLHVVVDKPLSNRLSECDRLVEAVEAAGVRSLVWNRNSVPAIRHARELVTSGRIGALRAIHCDFYFCKDAGPRKGSRGAEDPPIDWLERQLDAHIDGSDGAVGTEPMGELQVEGFYPLAFIHQLVESPIRRVYARTASHFHQAHADHGIDDLASVTLQMDDSVVGSICVGRIGAASHPDLGELKLHLLGTQGALVINESRPEVSVYYRGQSEGEFPHRRVADDYDAWLVDEFARAIESQTDTTLDVAGGRDVCRVIDACLRSAKAGTVVSV